MTNKTEKLLFWFETYDLIPKSLATPALVGPFQGIKAMSIRAFCTEQTVLTEPFVIKKCLILWQSPTPKETLKRHLNGCSSKPWHPGEHSKKNKQKQGVHDPPKKEHLRFWPTAISILYFGRTLSSQTQLAQLSRPVIPDAATSAGPSMLQSSRTSLSLSMLERLAGSAWHQGQVSWTAQSFKATTRFWMVSGSIDLPMVIGGVGRYAVLLIMGPFCRNSKLPNGWRIHQQPFQPFA